MWKHLLENYKLNEWHFQKTSLPTSSLVPSGTPKQPIDLRMTETPYSYVHYVTLQNQFIRNVPFRSQTPCPKMDPSAMCPLALAFLSGLLKDIHTMHSNRNCIKSELVMVTVFHCIGKKKFGYMAKKASFLHWNLAFVWLYHMTYSSPTALL